MAEFKKEIGVVAALAVITVIAVGLLAIVVFPNSLNRNSATTSISTAAPTITKTVFATSAINTSVVFTPPNHSTIAPLVGELSGQDISCSLTSGVCTLTIVNISTAALELENCQMQVILSSNATAIVYGIVNGTMGNPATAGIPADSQVAATCAIPTTQLAHESEGSVANGVFYMKLVDSAESYPAGTEAGFSFEVTWSS